MKTIWVEFRLAAVLTGYGGTAVHCAPPRARVVKAASTVRRTVSSSLQLLKSRPAAATASTIPRSNELRSRPDPVDVFSSPARANSLSCAREAQNSLKTQVGRAFRAIY